VSIEFRYYIDIVESEGGADFSFSSISDHELVPNEVVQDDLGRSYVVISTAETTPDPLDDGIRLGTATAKPA
jgi:hypothetical protein